MLELGFEVALVNSLLLATLRVLSSSPDVPNVENSACFDNTHTKIGTNSENGGRRHLDCQVQLPARAGCNCRAKARDYDKLIPSLSLARCFGLWEWDGGGRTGSLGVGILL